MAVDQQLADLLTTLGRTSDAMVAVGADMTIVAWNEGATELFGYTADEALGRPCYSVMCWRDRCGDPVCEECSVAPPGDDDELTPTREVIGRTADGKTLWLSATTTGWSLATEEKTSVLSRLTPRENEVLHLLTEGLDGSAIAKSLFVSPATVRNHVQHILKKLEVHSRTEAVALALRSGR